MLDLDPIEALWRIMKDKPDQLPLRPATVADMVQELQVIWNTLDPQSDTLPHILSLPTCICCLATGET